MQTYSELKAKLNELKTDYAGGIEALVLEDVLEYDSLEDIENYLSDVMRYGGQSGTVTRLIYTKENEKFFIKYGEQIFELLEGGDINLADFEGYQDFVNKIVWTAYEVATSRIYGLVFEGGVL